MRTVTLKNEPPGPRRVHLALRRKGLNQFDVARAANCERSTVSKVISGAITRSPLVDRIKQAVVELTGQRKGWLFAHLGHINTTANSRP